MSGPGILTIFAEAVAGTLTEVSIGLQVDQSRRNARQAKRAAERAEAEAEKRRREWLKLVRDQMTHGRARDATEADARAVNRRGGRHNPLDDRMF
jgi:hypothetical protein